MAAGRRGRFPSMWVGRRSYGPEACSTAAADEGAPDGDQAGFTSKAMQILLSGDPVGIVAWGTYDGNKTSRPGTGFMCLTPQGGSTFGPSNTAPMTKQPFRRASCDVLGALT